MTHTLKGGAVREAGAAPPYWSRVLRAFREAQGVTRAGWAAQLGFGRTTVQRWETGDAVPDALAEQALLDLCAEKGLLRQHDHGPLSGIDLSAERLRQLLAEARLALRTAPQRPDGPNSATVGAEDPLEPGGPERATSAARWTGPALPTGTLTFLFTDVEGSTRLWERHPEEMRSAMARHDTLLSHVFALHGGVVVRPRGEGDSLFAVFIRPTDAARAAVAGQQALAGADWGGLGVLRVRMALHTGEADLRDGDYYGPAVNRTARIRSAGHGGQVLLSRATADLLQGTLPSGTTLGDLGDHRLKDLARLERIFELVVPGLSADFPPLQTLENRPTNLPIQPNTLVGRDADVAAVTALLDSDVRLITLTGPGGIGKTRLAVQIAAAQLDAFTDGAFFVELDPLNDANLVAAAIAAALSVPAIPGQSLLEGLGAYLRDKALLLVLDNFEHVLASAPLVASLLGTCARLRVLVTSREPLRLRGEHQYAVPPLMAPAVGDLPAVDELTHYPAVRLFVERSQAVNAGFAIGAANAAAIVDICRRLDGLPLAIELAAARVKLLPPEALLVRLERRLPLLTSGARDLPQRQRTLRDTIAWSYDLLSAAEQRLVRRLAVFHGGCMLESAQAICDVDSDLGLDLLDGFASLIDKSLIYQADEPDREPRFRMLATIREFAEEKLSADADAEKLHQRHIAFFIALTEPGAHAAYWGPHWKQWFQRLLPERENIRAALSWAEEHNAAALGLRLAGSLHHFGLLASAMQEGLDWVERMLALPGAQEPNGERARALYAAGFLAWFLYDYELAATRLRESVSLWRVLGDKENLSLALGHLATSLRSDLEEARALVDESLALALELDSVWLTAIAHSQRGTVYERMGDVEGAYKETAQCLTLSRSVGADYIVTISQHNLARLALAGGALEEARVRLEACLPFYLSSGDKWDAALVLSSLGVIAQRQGDAGRAIGYFEESLRLSREVGNMRATADNLAGLGVLYVAAGNADRADALLCESAKLYQAIERNVGIAACLAGLAGVAALRWEYSRAAQLFGAAEAMREASRSRIPSLYQALYDENVDSVRANQSVETFAAAWAAGRQQSVEEAIAFALRL